MKEERVIVTAYIEAGSIFKKVPFALKKMLDDEGEARTPEKYMEDNDGTLLDNQDETRFMMPFEMSFKDPDYPSLVEAAKNPELAKLFDGKQPYVTEDLTDTNEEAIRVVIYTEKLELLEVNENWKIEEVE